MRDCRGNNQKPAKKPARKRAVLKQAKAKPEKECLPGYDEDGSDWDDDSEDILTEFDKGTEG